MNRLADRLMEQVGGEVRPRAVFERAAHARGWYGADPGTIIDDDIVEVEDDSFRNAKTTTRPARGERQVEQCLKSVREAVQGECREVGDDSLTLGPKPGGDEVLVVATGEVNEAIDASPYARCTAALNVMEQELCREAGFGGLLRCEEAFLRGRHFVQPVPTWARSTVGHAQMVSTTIDSCKPLACSGYISGLSSSRSCFRCLESALGRTSDAGTGSSEDGGEVLLGPAGDQRPVTSPWLRMKLATSASVCWLSWRPPMVWH